MKCSKTSVKKLKEAIKRILKKQLEEMSGTGAVAGVNTPYAFGKTGDATKGLNDPKNKVGKDSTGTLYEGTYPEVTLVMDKMGHLHLWNGNVKPVRVSKYKYETDTGKESDVYIQDSYDIQAVMESLSSEEKDDLDNGYIVHTTNVCDDYFVK